jgi:hypothetical protein
MDKTYEPIASEKGKEAEKLLAIFLSNRVFAHYVYLNPSLRAGKELCDVLVVFRNRALVLQAKNTKLSKNNLYRSSDVKKNVDQCRGAARALLKGTNTVSLENYAGITDSIDLSRIDTVYCIAVHHGERPEFYGFYDSDKALPVHIIDFESFQKLLIELSVLPELFNYLNDKQALFASDKSFLLSGGEQDLFASWIRQDRSFEKFEKADMVTLMEGIYDSLLEDDQYQTKKREDGKYGSTWEKVILTCLDLGPNYKVISDDFVDHNSLERRMLGRALREYLVAAIKNKTPTMRFTHYQLTPENMPERLYIMLFHGAEDMPGMREPRQKALQIIATIFLKKYVAQFPSLKTVIGIATDSVFTPTSPFEFMYAEVGPEWVEKIRANDELDEIAKQLNILQGNLRHYKASEYSESVELLGCV